MKKSLCINIYGRVQNVGFRYYTSKRANELGIKGFVKNMPDGSVYVEAEGESEIMDTFLDYCHQGPDWAIVSEITNQETPLRDFTSFSIR